MGGAVKAVKKIAKPIGGLLFGKDETLGADPIAGDVRKTAGQAMFAQQDILKDLKGMNTDRMAKTALAKQEAALRSSAADARRRLQENIARRGLGRSSLAFSGAKTIESELGDKIAAAQREMPLKRLQMLGAKGSIINPIATANQFPIQMRDIKQRKGGISGILGAGIGGMVGGPQGAGAGMQIGEGLKSIF